MGACRWLMFFVGIYLKDVESEASSWTSASPTSVKGLLGSCVVIPCSFNYPDEGNKFDFTGIWLHSEGIVFHSKEPQKVLQQYQNRLELVGDLKGKNCSLKIDALQQSDIGPFNFRVEIKNYDNYSYKNKVSISVIREPNPIQFSVGEDIKEGQNVSVACSVSHSCPTSPPGFKWNHPGEEIHQSQQLGDAEWKETSILSFRATHFDHNKPLNCAVTYRGGKKQEQFKIFHVKYAPVNVNVNYNSDVKEGETVALTCSSEAHPPVSRYEWHNATGAQISQGNLYIVSNVSRNIGAMYCTAINAEGQVKSRSVRLKVQYAPDVKNESSCSLEGHWVKCKCIVDSNPASTVTFKLGDKILPGVTGVENGSYTIKFLWKDIESNTFVECSADNMQGSANLKLLLPHDDMVLYMFIAAGAAGCLVVIVLVVGFIRTCRGKRGDTSGLNRSTVMTQRTLEPSQYSSESFPRKEICDDQPCYEIYQNENLYGNTGTDWNDQIYANV